MMGTGHILAVVTDLVPGAVVTGPLLPEPVEVIVVVPVGASVKLIGKGLRTGTVRDPILDAGQLAQLSVAPKEPLFDGDAARFKLGIEAARLGLAYEYDPIGTDEKRWNDGVLARKKGLRF